MLKSPVSLKQAIPAFHKAVIFHFDDEICGLKNTCATDVIYNYSQVSCFKHRSCIIFRLFKCGGIRKTLLTKEKNNFNHLSKNAALLSQFEALNFLFIQALFNLLKDLLKQVETIMPLNYL
jgi:hypothetical protein